VDALHISTAKLTKSWSFHFLKIAKRNAYVKYTRKIMAAKSYLCKELKVRPHIKPRDPLLENALLTSERNSQDFGVTSSNYLFDALVASGPF
jgi:hypothetical protein